MLTNQEIYKIVNGYIGVSGGYLGDFSYRTHREFYPEFCNLDIDTSKYEGTTRARFIHILKTSDPPTQAKILKGIISKYPVSFFPKEQRERKRELYEEIKNIIQRLEGASPITAPNLLITSEVVERAIRDAKTLIERNGATSGVDRIHTALHGYLKAVCKKENITVSDDPSLTELFKQLRDNHPALQIQGSRHDDIIKILRAISNILDALNPLRNKGSVAHPNENLLGEDEAMLVINSSQTILHYLNAKLKKVKQTHN